MYAINQVLTVVVCTKHEVLKTIGIIVEAALNTIVPNHYFDLFFRSSENQIQPYITGEEKIYWRFSVYPLW